MQQNAVFFVVEVPISIYACLGLSSPVYVFRCLQILRDEPRAQTVLGSELLRSPPN